MRDYNTFKTKVQDYMEYFCRRNDPKNIEDMRKMVNIYNKLKNNK